MLICKTNALRKRCIFVHCIWGETVRKKWFCAHVSVRDACGVNNRAIFGDNFYSTSEKNVSLIECTSISRQLLMRLAITEIERGTLFSLPIDLKTCRNLHVSLFREGESRETRGETPHDET